MKKIGIIALLGLFLGGAFFFGLSRGPDSQRLKGAVLLKADSDALETLQLARSFGRLPAGDPCTGDMFSSGYADITGGANIVIKDGGGETIATTNLGPGILTEDACSFGIDMNDLPESEFYEFLIANRKGPTFSRADLEQDGFEVTLTIGG